MTKKKEKTEQELNETTKFFEARKRFSAMPRLTANIKPSHKAVMARFQHHIGKDEPVNGDTVLALLRYMKEDRLENLCKRMNARHLKPEVRTAQDYVGDSAQELCDVIEVCQDASAILGYVREGYIPALEKSDMREMYCYKMGCIVAEMWSTFSEIAEDFEAYARKIYRTICAEKKGSLCRILYDKENTVSLRTLTEGDIAKMQDMVNPKKD